MFAAVDTARLVMWGAGGLLLLVAAVVALFLLAGLFGARSLVRRELAAYFLSPIAYVVLVVFLLVTGHLFYLTQQLLTEAGPRGAEFPMQVMFGDAHFWLVFLFIPPLLTMRLFAEERGSGTLEMLMTAPLRDWQVVLSKYAACFAFYLLLWVPTLAYLPVLLDLRDPVLHLTPWTDAQGVAHNPWTPWSITLVAGLAAVVLALLLALFRLGTRGRLVNLLLLVAGAAALGVGIWGHYTHDAAHLFWVTAGIDPMPVLSSYLGLALAGAMFLALGMLVSSLVRSQMVAALVSLVLSLVFIVAGIWTPQLDTSTPAYQVLAQVISFVSVPLHFSRDFSRGLVDSRHLVLYASVAVFSVFLTVRSLESRRWR
jgi:ABC-type transport system involved in multi-copper enzyme maturation permease subunit